MYRFYYLYLSSILCCNSPNKHIIIIIIIIGTLSTCRIKAHTKRQNKDKLHWTKHTVQFSSAAVYTPLNSACTPQNTFTFQSVETVRHSLLLCCLNRWLTTTVATISVVRGTLVPGGHPASVKTRDPEPPACIAQDKSSIWQSHSHTN